jgi:WD40 repeat protein
VVTTSEDSTARIWATASGETTAVLEHDRGVVVHAAFSTDSRLIATASQDRTARVWRADNGAEVARLSVGDWVTQVRFSPKGNLLVTATDSGKVLVWNAHTFERVFVLDGHKYGVFHVEFSPDEKYLVTVAGGIRPTGFPAQADRSARLWSVKDGHQVAKLEHVDSPITYAFFSPDSQSIVTCGVGYAQAWATRDGGPLRTFNVPAGWIYDCSMAPQGDKLLVTSSSGSASLLDFASGKLLQTTPRHPSGANAASQDRTGQRVVVGYEDGSAVVWKTFRSTQELIGFAQSVVPRRLTDKQRQKFSLE